MLSVNKDEAMELALSGGCAKDKIQNTKDLLQYLKAMGPEIILVTSGQQGADVYDGQKFYHQDILKEKKRVDTTGVGDAFGSSFVAGLELYEGDIKKALYLGAKNTASVIGQQGAQNGLIKM